MHEALFKLDATAQAELVRTKQLSALELVDAAIARIEKLEPTVHALASSAFDQARERARMPLHGPLAGVPTLLKDVLSYPGLPFMIGSRLFASNVAREGSPYTQRLDEAGLIPLGKTTTSEFGLLGSTETLLSGATFNPWDLSRSAMGSSGGSVAAVASGMVPVAHASDGGGSIRIPASATGLFGFKPGRGRCVASGPSDMHGLLIDHAVTRSVRDSALWLSLTEQRACDAKPLGMVLPQPRRKLRIGYYTQTLAGEEPSLDVQRALTKTVGLCSELQHELVPIAAPRAHEQGVARDSFFIVAGAGIAQVAQMVEPMIGGPLSEAFVEPFTLALLHWYRTLPADALERALSYLTRLSHDTWQQLAPFDAVLCPTMPTVAPLLGTFAPTLDRELLMQRTESLAGYTALHSFAGVPAMSVPLFSSEAGLPIGSQFAAPLGMESTLLELAYQLEEALPWSSRWPQLALA